MIGNEPKARVIVELNPDDVPELLNHLGSFAAHHAISFSPGTVLSGESVVPAKDEFNPQYAELVTLHVDDEPVPVVTSALLDSYIRSLENTSVSQARRIFRRLEITAKRDDSVKTMLYGEEGLYGFEASGIRVSHMRELVKRLQTQSLSIESLKRVSISILSGYCDLLFPNKTSEI